MKTKPETLQALYDKIYNVYNEWIKFDTKNKLHWSTERYNNYLWGPVVGLYIEKDKSLIDILNDDFEDSELYDLLIPIKEKALNKLLYAPESNLMTKLQCNSYQNELSLLRDRKINDWLNKFFIPCITSGCFEIDESHFRGLCYVTYGYENYKHDLTSIYCGDTDILRQLYQGVLGKNSDLYTYKLIEITSACEMLAIEPPRIYDSRINKTLYLVNVSKELLDTFIELGKLNLYKKISVRVYNSIINIFDGRYRMQTISESIEMGKIFSVQHIGEIPVTKLYSVNYEDSLWVKISDSEITFEELYENETAFNSSIITQVIHLNYLRKNTETLITHLDHEFVFYSKSDYEKRKTNSDIKGNKYSRLKSFKIDKANIPLTLPIKRNLNLYNEASGEISRKEETVPFIIYILKCYLKHTDLIDEYFSKL